MTTTAYLWAVDHLKTKKTDPITLLTELMPTELVRDQGTALVHPVMLEPGTNQQKALTHLRRQMGIEPAWADAPKMDEAWLRDYAKRRVLAAIFEVTFNGRVFKHVGATAKRVMRADLGAETVHFEYARRPWQLTTDPAAVSSDLTKWFVDQMNSLGVDIKLVVPGGNGRGKGRGRSRNGGGAGGSGGRMWAVTETSTDTRDFVEELLIERHLDEHQTIMWAETIFSGVTGIAVSSISAIMEKYGEPLLPEDAYRVVIMPGDGLHRAVRRD